MATDPVYLISLRESDLLLFLQLLKSRGEIMQYALPSPEVIDRQFRHDRLISELETQMEEWKDLLEAYQ